MDRLTLLAERLPRSRYAAACCYIDGFTDFTAQERLVIGGRHARRLPLGPQRDGKDQKKRQADSGYKDAETRFHTR